MTEMITPRVAIDGGIPSFADVPLTGERTAAAPTQSTRMMPKRSASRPVTMPPRPKATIIKV